MKGREKERTRETKREERETKLAKRGLMFISLKKPQQREKERETGSGFGPPRYMALGAIKPTFLTLLKSTVKRALMFIV